MTAPLRAFDRALAVAAGGAVVALLATVMAGVLSRALNQPLSWTDEAAGYLMAWTACLGWMVATRRHAHIRIRFFLDRLPPSLQRATEALFLAGVALLGAVVAGAAVQLVQRNLDIDAVALPLSSAWLYVPLVGAGALTLVQALADLVALSRPARPAPPAEPAA